ncbi:MAG: hypothetical protein FWD66_00305 [Paludibacter sp.]|nr:hypothetical protein [Paludibacter sp.]
MENNNFNGMQISLPNASAVLVLGIISIPVCCCYGFISIILAVIALILAKNAAKLYAATPENFLESSYKNLKAGKICATIGLILGIIYIILCIVVILIFGLSALSNPEQLQEILKQYQ